jgi:flavorubredoxin
LHSSGNFHLYDEKAKILFSGDVGAAMLPPEANDLFVQDFDRHIRHAEGFHRRWMGSNDAKLDWCERASKMEIDMLCPQHGAIYQGKNVERFVNWFAELPVASYGMKKG